jgi:hypothetical protein
MYGNTPRGNHVRKEGDHPAWPRPPHFAAFQPKVYTGIENFRRERSMGVNPLNQIGISGNTMNQEVSCRGMQVQQNRSMKPGNFTTGFYEQPANTRPRNWRDKGTFNLFDRSYLTADLSQKRPFLISTETY